MTMRHPEAADVSAIVCTKNSIASIQACLESLKGAGVGEIIVVDAGSDDGTRGVADSLADLVLEDRGTGLGQARNIGIAASRKNLILNMGSDNVLLSGQLERMFVSMSKESVAGVSAQTRVPGSNYVGRGLNAWRKGRFRPGPARIIGTPTLFRAQLLRERPFDSSRRFSDDSELCERWTQQFGARFEISDAVVLEVGKGTWSEVVRRCKMYGESDHEIYEAGVQAGWSWTRRFKSLRHPWVVDTAMPLRNLDWGAGITSAPFFLTFTLLRYFFWARSAMLSSHRRR